MNLEINILETAKEDIYGIYGDLTARENTKADLFFEKVESTYKKLSAMPRLGRIYPFKIPTSREYRYLPIEKFNDFYIFYVIGYSTLDIYRVINARMNIQRVFENEENN